MPEKHISVNRPAESPFYSSDFSPATFLFTFNILFLTVEFQKMHLMNVYRCFSLVLTQIWKFFDTTHCRRLDRLLISSPREALTTLIVWSKFQVNLTYGCWLFVLLRNIK